MARAFRRKQVTISTGSTGSPRQVERFAATLDPPERHLVLILMEQVLDLLARDAPAPAASAEGESADSFEAIVAGLALGESPPAQDARSFGDRDPALQRLLPTANRTDPEAAAEFRRLAEAGLRQRKIDNLALAARALDRPGRAVELTEPDAIAVLVALTDVRLVLGERLGLRTDDDLDNLEAALAEDDNDPRAAAASVYDFLTWLQESLSAALMRP